MINLKIVTILKTPKIAIVLKMAISKLGNVIYTHKLLTQMQNVECNTNKITKKTTKSFKFLRTQATALLGTKNH